MFMTIPQNYDDALKKLQNLASIGDVEKPKDKQNKAKKEGPQKLNPQDVLDIVNIGNEIFQRFKDKPSLQFGISKKPDLLLLRSEVTDNLRGRIQIFSETKKAINDAFVKRVVAVKGHFFGFFAQYLGWGLKDKEKDIFNLIKNYDKKIEELNKELKAPKSGSKSKPEKEEEGSLEEEVFAHAKLQPPRATGSDASKPREKPDQVASVAVSTGRRSAIAPSRPAARHDLRAPISVSARALGRDIKGLSRDIKGSKPRFSNIDDGLRAAYNRIIGNKSVRSDNMEGISAADGIESIKDDIDTFRTQYKDALDVATSIQLKNLSKRLAYAEKIAIILDDMTSEEASVRASSPSPAPKSSEPKGIKETAAQAFKGITKVAKGAAQGLDNFLNPKPSIEEASRVIPRRFFLHEIVVDIHKKISGLKEGEEIILPGGFKTLGKTDEEEGHAILYRIERQKNNKLSFTIFNTGMGAHKHKSILEIIGGMVIRGKASDTIIKDIEPEDLSSDFLTDLLKQNVTEPRESLKPKKSPKNSMDGVGKIIERLIKNKKQVLAGKNHDLQANGTCSHSCVCSYIETALPQVLSAAFDLHMARSGIQYLDEVERSIGKQEITIKATFPRELFPKKGSEVLTELRKMGNEHIIAQSDFLKDVFLKQQKIYDKAEEALKKAQIEFCLTDSEFLTKEAFFEKTGTVQTQKHLKVMEANRKIYAGNNSKEKRSLHEKNAQAKIDIQEAQKKLDLARANKERYEELSKVIF